MCVGNSTYEGAEGGNGGSGFGALIGFDLRAISADAVPAREGLIRCASRVHADWTDTCEEGTACAGPSV